MLSMRTFARLWVERNTKMRNGAATSIYEDSPMKIYLFNKKERWLPSVPLLFSLYFSFQLLTLGF